MRNAQQHQGITAEVVESVKQISLEEVFGVAEAKALRTELAALAARRYGVQLSLFADFAQGDTANARLR